MQPAEWGFTLANEPDYRGHARGFHFFFNEVLAAGLIFACLFDRKIRTKFFPPGLWLWFAYIALSLLSVFNAPLPHYVWMSALKTVKVALIFVATFNVIRDEDDLHFFLSTMTFTMLWEMLVVLKMKYVDERYQVWGTFEHQNSLCMYTTMIGMVLLAAGAGPKYAGKFLKVLSKGNLYLIGFLATAVIVQSTLSRAGVVVFAGGTMAVMCLSLVDKISKRKMAVVAALGLIAMIGLAFTMDTIIARFNDTYNKDSNETRVRLNKASAAMLKDKPLGVGWNLYAHVINPPYRYGDVIDEWFIMHNEPLEKGHRKGISESMYWLLLAETGYQGFAGFILLIAVFLWRNIRGALFFRNHLFGCVSLGIAMGCSTNYAQSLLERVLTQPRNMMLWMILLAITAKIEVWRRKAKKERKLAKSVTPEIRRRSIPEKSYAY